MAYIVRKEGKPPLVRWRDKDGRLVSQQCPNDDAAERLRALMEIEEGMRPRKARTGYRADEAAKRFIKKRVPMQPTFAEYARKVIDRDTSLRLLSRRAYFSGLKNHIEGTSLGNARLNELTPNLVADFWANLKANHAAVKILLSKVFNEGDLDGVIYGDPYKRARLVTPAKRKKPVKVLTVAQIERLADAAMYPRDRVMILLMAYGGLRGGEVGGLRVQDVNVQRCTLGVTEQATVYGPGEIKSDPRLIQVECGVIEELAEFVAANPPAEDGRIFHGRNGAYYHSTRIGEIVRKAAKRARLTGVYPHLLRHTAASMVWEDHKDWVKVAEYLGDSVETVRDTYIHLFDTTGSGIAATMTARREAYRNGM